MIENGLPSNLGEAERAWSHYLGREEPWIYRVGTKALGVGGFPESDPGSLGSGSGYRGVN